MDEATGDPSAPASITESAGKEKEGSSKTVTECKLPAESEKVKGKAKKEYHETSLPGMIPYPFWSRT